MNGVTGVGSRQAVSCQWIPFLGIQYDCPYKHCNCNVCKLFAHNHFAGEDDKAKSCKVYFAEFSNVMRAMAWGVTLRLVSGYGESPAPRLITLLPVLLYIFFKVIHHFPTVRKSHQEEILPNFSLAKVRCQAYLQVSSGLQYSGSFSDCKWRRSGSRDPGGTPRRPGTRTRALCCCSSRSCSPATSRWSTWTWWWRTPCHWRKECRGSPRWYRRELHRQG